MITDFNKCMENFRFVKQIRAQFYTPFQREPWIP